MRIVEIDKYSGFCFGVKKAIESASELLESGEEVFCVGDIVHNEEESKRLNQIGMSIITIDDVDRIKGGTILFRAHGEPPQSYASVKQSGLPLRDATCPVVLKLHERIKKAYASQKDQNGQIVIYGKRGHAEVIGLAGQTNDEAIIIENISEIDTIDFSRPVEIFAQTTKSPEIFHKIVDLLQQKCRAEVKWHNTTCKQVTGRVPRIQSFAKAYPLIVFVGGRKSSNAKVLFKACQEVNPNSYFVSSPEEVKEEWFNAAIDKAGVCGATSTPQWLMEKVADRIRTIR
ncbi:4-hydroxy-3-methylbut-2-enyl diphosphate reductase [Carboxylicivirga sp. RSCT41]|uniref:4-hydroxy-3-methylbut-2-enyl diphosphate reductase n=1 Tax=Carboxylicivirga agarovorans TaxID=3417570 RepID=UPI003D3249DE